MTRFVVIIISICFAILLALFAAKNALSGFDITALIGANLLLAILSLLSAMMMQRKMKEGRPQAFVNGVYSATLMRLMICLSGIFIYAYATKDHLHKPTIFLMMGFYLVYSFTETILLSRKAKQ